jgi:hypothetical protein
LSRKKAKKRRKLVLWPVNISHLGFMDIRHFIGAVIALLE